jgi:vacuolar-type H+-ATPase subunit I/STV1
METFKMKTTIPLIDKEDIEKINNNLSEIVDDYTSLYLTEREQILTQEVMKKLNDKIKDLEQRIKNCEAYLISISDFDFNYEIPNAILDNDKKIIKEYIEEQTKAYRNFFGKDYEEKLMNNDGIRCLINLGYLKGEENDE